MSEKLKKSKEILKLDVYEILKLSIEASESEIKKAFRKKALKCHPDKNPGNPAAAYEFDQLKKILEILLDPGSRAAYDRVLKGRKLAALRQRETSAKTQKLRHALERREQDVRNRLSDEERFAREIRRLEEEGVQLIADELERLNQQTKQERADASRVAAEAPEKAAVDTSDNRKEGSFKVKVRWSITDSEDFYTKDKIHTLFYKWGELNAVVLKQKGSKGTALVDYKTKDGAEMACQFECGLPECPLTVTELIPAPTPASSTPAPTIPGVYGAATTRKDFESLADMEKRRRNERASLIQEMLRSDGVEQDT